ncbi:9155_t:CDS:2 [Funneliformis geosporum]|uniref:9155_t:CDS:1 n=1 Tax=Funneliformis geosporum TaxID=1117311 RepID=A0A9W4SV23_9GLOM|nr:9155_t:CDS:2 [Funneliformis geosporum]
MESSTSLSTNVLASAPVEINTIKKIEYPFWFGGAASCIACTVSHPLDLTKVRLQTTQGLNKASTIYTMIRIVKDEGIRGLYSGLSASILRQATYSTMRFGAYEKLKTAISKNQGCIGGAFGNPADLVMVRMQNDAKQPSHMRRNYRNAFDGLYRIVQEDGLKGLTRGIVPNMNRAILMNSSQLASYDQFKQMLLSTKFFKDNIITHFTCSVLAGLVATTICSPVDVIKTRVMNSSSEAKSILVVLTTIISKEGPLALFKGWVPAFVRLGPHTVVTFMVLEQIKNLYHKKLDLSVKKTEPATA